MPNKTYLFSVESYAHFQMKYTTLMQRINNLYKEINRTIQMDHQSDELSNLYAHYEELKLLAKQLEEISQSIEIIPETNGVHTLPLKINIGATVTLQFNNDKIENYKIVPYGETNMNKHMISYTHPFAQKLLEQSEGGMFEYNEQYIVILAINYYQIQ